MLTCGGSQIWTQIFSLACTNIEFFCHILCMYDFFYTMICNVVFVDHDSMWQKVLSIFSRLINKLHVVQRCFAQMGQLEVFFINLAPWLTIQISLVGCENLSQRNSYAVELLKTAVTEVQYYPSCFSCIYDNFRQEWNQVKCSNYIPVTQTENSVQN